VANRRLALLTCVIAAATGFTACRGSQQTNTSNASASAVPQRGGALIASIRSEPSIYNRNAAGGAQAATTVVTLLTQAPLVRVNRVTDELEPWLAESWTTAADGQTYTITLRQGIQFSDGRPLTSADVVFSFQLAYDPKAGSTLGQVLTIGGKPFEVSAPDPRTVVVRLPERFAPGLRVLDQLPILPKHVLEGPLASGQIANTWVPSKPVSEVVGLGPFVIAEHVAGQRLVFTRNPHYFRRDANGVQLPYLDRLTLAIVPDQSAEALRLEAAEIDLMANTDLRPQDYASFKRLSEQGRLRLLEGTVGVDPDFLSFNLRPGTAVSKRAPWLLKKEVRQGISCGVDRQAIINAVYLGAAVPLYGPVTPGNKTWFVEVPGCTADRTRARALFAAAGLTDRNGDGMLEDAAGAPARFSILTHGGHLRERVSAMLQEQLRQVGIAVDIVALDPKGLFQRWQAGDFDTLYFGVQASFTDPALNPDFWFSNGAFYFWNPGQKTPATPWERRIDELMHEQMTNADLSARKKAFADVQRILAEELPSIYFVAPRATLATSPKVVNPTPAPQIPQLLWAADTLAAASR
jgi:peptide/nickel transport system substrate-binding protein